MDETEPIGDAHGEWYYCFKHETVEQRYDCNQMDRMGPYPTREDAENWRSKVEDRNRKWEESEER